MNGDVVEMIVITSETYDDSNQPALSCRSSGTTSTATSSQPG
jgi:hypothetical protein